MRPIICGLAIVLSLSAHFASAQESQPETRTLASASDSYDPEMQRLEQINDELKQSLLSSHKSNFASQQKNDGLKVKLIRIRK